jgi:predicted transcriptional regulator YdeE
LKKIIKKGDAYVRTKCCRYGTTLDDPIRAIQERFFVGLQNQLPQSYEDEQQLFTTLEARKNEIMGQTMDGNTYMVIHDNGSKMTVGLSVNQLGEVPDDMVSLILPDEEYVVFRFEENHICSFWQYFCDQNNQKKYQLDTVKARFETFNDSLQPNGITEIYYPKSK